MKQFYVVNSAAALNGGAASPKDLSGMVAGSIGFYALDNPNAWLSAKAEKDFAIVYGRGAKSPAIVFPEVDIKTLQVVKSAYTAGNAYSAKVTIPEPTPNDNYTLVLVKLGAKFNERANYTVTEFIPINGKMTAEELATSLTNQLKAKAEMGNLDITVEQDGASITITGLTAGEGFSLKGGDGLAGLEVTETPAKAAFGDMASIKNLVAKEAAGKGFTDVYEDGPTVYPGYPEPVEDKQYDVITLRFAVGRKASKTRDERVSQLVHIAVPTDSAAYATIKTILGVA